MTAVDVYHLKRQLISTVCFGRQSTENLHSSREIVSNGNRFYSLFSYITNFAKLVKIFNGNTPDLSYRRNSKKFGF